MAESTNSNGIQILVPSQYTDVYKISTYGGAAAMVTKPNSLQLIWLDKEFDRPEFLPNNISAPIKTNDIGTGDFKINMHLGYPGGKKVGNWSEDGSQVFATADELKDFFSNCEKHRELYDNSFSYTLVTKDDWDTAVRNVEANKGSKNAIPEKQITAAEKEEPANGTSGTSVTNEKTQGRINTLIFKISGTKTFDTKFNGKKLSDLIDDMTKSMKSKIDSIIDLQSTISKQYTISEYVDENFLEKFNKYISENISPSFTIAEAGSNPNNMITQQETLLGGVVYTVYFSS